MRAAFLLMVASIVACTMKPGAPPDIVAARRTIPPDVVVPRRGTRLVVVRTGAQVPDTTAAVAFVEVASTDVARMRGLGGRESLAPNSGMLFVYGVEMIHRFWMKDCLISLDIAFIDRTGRIANIATLPPGAGLPDVSIPAAGSIVPVLWVLETDAGWLARHDVVVGDHVDLGAALVGIVPK